MLARVKAFLAHLGISALVALLAIILVFIIWHPAPLQDAVGVTSIFILLLSIDVILGPLLTLVVFKPGKKGLKKDLAIIGCLQLCALGYGLYTVAEGRPSWLVFAQDRFELVRFYEIDRSNLQQAASEYRSAPLFSPQLVTAPLPTDPEERAQILFEELQGGSSLAQRPEYYQPLEQHSDSIRPRIRPLNELESFNHVNQVQRLVATHPNADGWLPLSANQQDMVVLMQRDSAEVIAIVDLRPW